VHDTTRGYDLSEEGDEDEHEEQIEKLLDVSCDSSTPLLRPISRTQ
jgi:hypothetical protein